MLVNLFIFAIGLIVGSFLNVCISRLPQDKSIIYPSSHCPHCKKPIKFYDNIPLISYLLLAGKCRNCKKPISIRYPIVELATGLLFLALPLGLGLGVAGYGFYFVASFICFLIINFFSDLETQTVPDWPSFIIIFLGLIYNFLSGTIVSSLFGIFVGFSILYLIGFFGKLYYKKDVLGEGDIKLTSAFGAFLGWQGVLFAIFLGYLIGAIFALGLIALKKKSLTDYIPFAPALTASALITLFWGSQLINFYVANFH